MYNKKMKYSIPSYESRLAQALYQTFGCHQGEKYEDEKIKIIPYLESDFDRPGFEWFNLIWKPTNTKYSYIKHLGNGTLESTSDSINEFEDMISYIKSFSNSTVCKYIFDIIKDEMIIEYKDGGKTHRPLSSSLREVLKEELQHIE